MKFKNLISIVVITGLVFANETLNLTLEKAIELALKNNIEVQNARESVRQAQLQKKEAFASGLPVVSGFIQNTHNFSIASQPLKFPVPFGQLDNNGNPVPTTFNPNLQQTEILFTDVDLKFGQDNTAVYGISVNQPLFEGRVIAAVRGAGSYQNMSKYGLETAMLRIIERTTVNFYGVLLSQEALKVMEASLSFAKKNQYDTGILMKQGKATEFEMIRADVRVANFEAAVSNAKKGLFLATANLKRECGIRSEESIKVEGEFSIPEDEILSFESYSALLLDNQPVLKQVNESIRLAKENILLNKAEFMPSVFLSGSIQNIQPYNDGNYNSKNFDKSSSLGLTISLPIFNGFGSVARVQKARSEHRKTLYLVEDTREALLLELSNIVLTLKEAEDRIRAGKKGVDQANRGVEIAQELYSKGMMSQIDLMDANQGRNQAELGLLQALFEYHSAKASLNRAINTDSNTFGSN